MSSKHLSFEQTELRHARLHIYSLCLTFGLWAFPHYRSPSYAQDLRDNLKNLAIPGTFLPLSVWIPDLGANLYVAKSVALLFLLLLYPALCLLSAVATLFVERDGAVEFVTAPLEWVLGILGEVGGKLVEMYYSRVSSLDVLNDVGSILRREGLQIRRKVLVSCKVN